MFDRDIKAEDVASQIGIDPALITSDFYNTPAHYVALYHELNLANDMGILEEVVRNQRLMVGAIIRDSFLPMYKLSEDGSPNPNWKPMFKESAKEYADINLSAFMQIANKLRSQSNPIK
jgi:hypothetical protein